MFRRDWRRRDALSQLLHTGDLQLRQLCRVGHHDSWLLIQRAQGKVMLIDLVDIVIVDRAGIFLLVQRQVIVVVVSWVVMDLMGAVEVQS